MTRLHWPSSPPSQPPVPSHCDAQSALQQQEQRPLSCMLAAATACNAGQYGASTVRRTAVDTGAVQLKTPMSNNYFGEGLARFGDKLYQITWLTNEGFIYSIPDLKQVGGDSGAARCQHSPVARFRLRQSGAASAM